MCKDQKELEQCMNNKNFMKENIKDLYDVQEVFDYFKKSANIQCDLINEVMEKNPNNKSFVDECKGMLEDNIVNDSNRFNDMYVEYIIEYIMKHSDDDKMKSYISNTYFVVGNFFKPSKIYKCKNDKFCCIIGEDFTRKLTNNASFLAFIIVTSCVDPSNDTVNTIKKNLAEQILLNNKFVIEEEYLVKYLQNERLMCGESLFDKFIALQNEIYEISLCNIISHEIFHAYLKHFGAKGEPKKMEIEADEKSFQFTINYFKSCDDYQKWSLIGILLPFYSIENFDSAKDVVTDSHPTISERIKKCEGALGLNEVSNDVLAKYNEKINVLLESIKEQVEN